MKGADKKKGLRPDTISDIISALCIPLNNDSISTRTVHLFIPFPSAMNLRKIFFFFLSLVFWLETTSGKVRETVWNNVIDIVEYFKTDDMCLRGHCAALVACWKWLDNPGQITQGSTPVPRRGSSLPRDARWDRGFKWDYKPHPCCNISLIIHCCPHHMD